MTDIITREEVRESILAAIEWIGKPLVIVKIPSFYSPDEWKRITDGLSVGDLNWMAFPSHDLASVSVEVVPVIATIKESESIDKLAEVIRSLDLSDADADKLFAAIERRPVVRTPEFPMTTSPVEPEDEREADVANRLRYLIEKRTGIAPGNLVCPREKSSMTPCVARDGALAVAGSVCVGCDRSVESLLEEEEAKS